MRKFFSNRGRPAAALAAGYLALAIPAARASGPFVIDRVVVDADTVWSGDVLVRGQVIVRKGATLTVEPGTTVRFAFSDDDGDGIGDGELYIEGRLVARGTKAAPVVFTSGRDEPRPKDWTYVLLNFNRNSIIEHCRFEYAFTGLQVHFSTATVRRSLFRNNFEAMRFSTAHTTIEQNDFTGNTYGIRYESRGSQTVISRNRFRDNDYAFFPVVKSTSTVRIFDNNIESRVYNVKLGIQQREDLDFRQNWWGTAERERIAAGIFDRRRDPALGEVLFEPFLAAPVLDAGMGASGR